MTKAISITICILLLVYFMFTSGLVFEESYGEMEGKIDLPYTLALSGERTGIVGIFNDDDVACAKWLADKYGALPIQADYNGYRLLLGCIHELEGFAPPAPGSEHYLFLTSWNVKHQLMVIGVCPGLRRYEPLPDLDGAVEAFRRGDAVVYFVEGNKEMKE